MKSRKSKTIQDNEKRNALYHKTILHNQELAQKNTELSQRINTLTNQIKDPSIPWWCFWKVFKYIKLRA